MKAKTPSKLFVKKLTFNFNNHPPAGSIPAGTSKKRKMKKATVQVTLSQPTNVQLKANELLFDKVFEISTDEQKKALESQKWSSTKAMIESLALRKAFENGLNPRGQLVKFKIL